MKAEMKLPKFELLLGDNAKLISDLDGCAEECVKAGQDIQFEAMKAGLERHHRTGETVESLKKGPVLLEGNTASGETGAFFDSDTKAFMRALYQEFGSPTFKMDPWLRPAVDSTKSQIRTAWKKIVESRCGVKLK